LSGLQTGQFLLGCVVIPSLCGKLSRRSIGFDTIRRLGPALKCANSLILVVLCYTNAAVALPQIFAEPDWGFLVIVGAATLGLCLLTFASGWVLARMLNVDSSRRRSLMFGLGMNNNGSGDSARRYFAECIAVRHFARAGLQLGSASRCRESALAIVAKNRPAVRRRGAADQLTAIDNDLVLFIVRRLTATAATAGAVVTYWFATDVTSPRWAV
jgi:hypothetical protein